jgi:hypothetical protein
MNIQVLIKNENYNNKLTVPIYMPESKPIGPALISPLINGFY